MTFCFLYLIPADHYRWVAFRFYKLYEGRACSSRTTVRNWCNIFSRCKPSWSYTIYYDWTRKFVDYKYHDSKRYIWTILSWNMFLDAVYYITNYFTCISDKTGEILVKILDFQEYRYESFANDLISFLLLCARFDDLTTNFISFIEFYHLEFTNMLKSVHLPLEDYTYDK